MQTVDVLRAARKKIEREENWCQGRAHDIDGNRCCAYGALCVSGATIGFDVAQWIAVRFNLPQGHKMRLADFNDTHTHAEVLELFDKAIALAEKEQVGT